jgi:hypothetical protein
MDEPIGIVLIDRRIKERGRGSAMNGDGCANSVSLWWFW